jgi:hypothetical protein
MPKSSQRFKEFGEPSFEALSTKALNHQIASATTECARRFNASTVLSHDIGAF